MENASKALIIAGAILISILLIGVGMFIFNAANEPLSSAGSQMDEMAKNMFNSKFENYEGKQKGSSVKALISAIITSNAQNEDGLKVTVNTDNDTAAELSTYRSSITDGKTYTVKIVYNDAGLVANINIT